MLETQGLLLRDHWAVKRERAFDPSSKSWGQSHLHPQVPRNNVQCSVNIDDNTWLA